MEIVVNEWLLDYLLPDAAEEERNLARRFMIAWPKKNDKVVIRRQSPFTRKLYRYLKATETKIDFNRPFLRLHKFLFRDSDKTILVEESEITKLPNELEATTPPDDKYLIELAYSKPDRIILTSDTKLKEQLKDEIHLKIYLLEEFLQNYPVQN